MNFIGRGPWDIFSVLCKIERDKTFHTLFIPTDRNWNQSPFPPKSNLSSENQQKDRPILIVLYFE